MVALLCRPINSTLGTRFLRSAEQGLLQVPFARSTTRQNHAFLVYGPSVWNSLLFFEHSSEPTLKLSLYNSDLCCSAALRLGARVWVVPLEKALYKSVHWINEWMNACGFLVMQPSICFPQVSRSWAKTKRNDARLVRVFTRSFLSLIRPSIKSLKLN